MTTTKRDFALAVSKAIGCKKSDAAKMVDALFIALRESLINGNRIEIRGFGAIDVKNTKPKPSARNPRTGPHEESRSPVGRSSGLAAQVQPSSGA